MSIGFRMPTPVSILARSSSITNSYINAIIPVVQPSEAEITEALDILGMCISDVRCAYCGDQATEWDHLRPLVIDQRPTGFISEIGNLVPACSKCNQSKGNKPWPVWIHSNAPRSPKTRGIEDLDVRIQRLTEYENWRPAPPVDFRSLVGADLWDAHWQNWERVLAAMQESQFLAAEIRERIRAGYSRPRTSDVSASAYPE